MAKIHRFKFRSGAAFLALMLSVALLSTIFADEPATPDSFGLNLRQITEGPKHHIFGYIGQCQTIPWNASGRYILGLELDFIDRLPEPQDAATVFIIDTHQDNKIIRLDQSHAWNPQQGTMFYWNPNNAEHQFFFNDRDVETGRVFTVLYDIQEKKRIREYRFAETPIGNSGVAIDGSAFMALNYGRLARLRRVTGYPQALDWSRDEVAPTNDGIFTVDIATGAKRLIVSYRQMEDEMKKHGLDLNRTGLFVNHTLVNRESDRLYFFARCEWTKFPGTKKGPKGNVAFTVNLDGSNLTLHEQHIGGHPEWDLGNTMLGSIRKDGELQQTRYDTETHEIVGRLGDAKMFPKPEGDIALSPDGNWFVNGYKLKRDSAENFYAVYRRTDSAFARSPGVNKGPYSENRDLRIDPAPRWNRENNAILVPGVVDGVRQLFVLDVIEQ